MILERIIIFVIVFLILLLIIEWIVCFTYSSSKWKKRDGRPVITAPEHRPPKHRHHSAETSSDKD